ncbi:MAG: cytochrome c biogenesis protein ResB [Halopseudomonas sp.]
MTFLASLKLTLACLLWLLLSVYLAYHFAGLSEQNDAALWLLVPPLAMLSFNLIAAIITNPSFRAQPALLLFHIALLAIALLIGIGQLMNMKGWTEVAVGAVYDGSVNEPRAGLLHPWHIEELRFINVGFEIDYAPGPSRRHTSNQIRWQNSEGEEQMAVIGDQVPLLLQGYRFYTSFNKGFAPKFLWRDAQGQVLNGVVHLPAWPEHEFNQSTEWTPAGSKQMLWMQLEFDDPILSEDSPSRFRLPKTYQLVVRVDEQRVVLQPGDELQLSDGVLVFLGLTTWMGYSIFYDPTRHWLLAACLLAVVSIAWHFWNKYANRPWLQQE